MRTTSINRSWMKDLIPDGQHTQLSKGDFQAHFAQLFPSFAAINPIMRAGLRLTPNNIRHLLSVPGKLDWGQQPDNQSALKIKAIDTTQAENTERWMSQILTLDELGENEMDVDVVVIGSGAGGSAAAWELASQGLAVAMVEEGDHYTRKDFNGNLPALLQKLYRNQGITGSIGNTFIPIPIGQTVGGTTTINSGTCLRPPNAVLSQWRDSGLSDMNANKLDRYFETIETALSVSKADPKSVGPIADIIQKGARANGLVLSHHLQRNAVGCDGQGLCQFGCPTGAKQSTNVSLIPRFLERGGLLIKQAKAQKILWKGNEVSGLQVVNQSSSSNKITSLTLHAKHLIVAAGSLITPRFLYQNGVRNKWLGKNLSLHPAGAMGAWFPGSDMKNSHTIPQGFGVDDLAHEGILFEGATPPLQGFALFSPQTGDAFTRQMEKYQETAFFGFMIKDTSRGSVGLPPLVPESLNFYRMNKQDFQRFKRAMLLLGKMFFSAGAKEVYIAGFKRQPVIRSLEELKMALAAANNPREFLISAYHPLGTARVASSPKAGVCDPNHRVFGKKGLYVMDGSSVPSALGANPQITIMSLAVRAAERLARTYPETTL